jgi:glycine cleavage system H lipoate-binding protein
MIPTFRSICSTTSKIRFWYEPLDDGTIRVGFTKWAAKLMGEILVFTPKRLGFDFEPNRSFGVLEGGKWAGSARAAFDGVVVSHNERQLVPESGAPINSIANGRVLLGTCLFGVPVV